MNTSGGLSSIAFPGTATPSTWKFLGIGDFNHDGTIDIAWQDQNPSDNQDGLAGLWLMDKNSPGITSSMTFPDTAPPASWKFLGIGDFDGNGTADLAWQDQNSSDSSYGPVATWLMNTSGGVSSVTFPDTMPPTTGKLLAIADFNQDGTADLVWQDVNTSDSSYGLVGIWLLHDGAFSRSTFPASINPSNMQLTIGNVLGDNPPDLLWHHLATGQVIDWHFQSGRYGRGFHGPWHCVTGNLPRHESRVVASSHPTLGREFLSCRRNRLGPPSRSVIGNSAGNVVDRCRCCVT